MTMPHISTVLPKHAFDYPDSADIKKQIRESLGLSPKPEVKPQLVVEGHVCDVPLWSFSKQRSRERGVYVFYPDGSFFMVDTPKGMPGPRFPGYLDVILFYGQQDLFLQDHTSISVYRIFQALEMDPHHSGNYAHFGVPGVISGKFSVREIAATSPLVAMHNYI